MAATAVPAQGRGSDRPGPAWVGSQWAMAVREFRFWPVNNRRHRHYGGLHRHALHSAASALRSRLRSLFLASCQDHCRHDAADEYKIPSQWVTLACQVFSKTNQCCLNCR